MVPGLAHTSRRKYKDRDCHPNCREDGRNSDPLFPKEGANECCILMEDSSECLADSVNLGPESCSVYWEGFEPSLSFYFYIWELSLKILDSISYLLLNFRVTRLCQFLMLPGQVFFDFGFALVDLRQLRQIVHHLISHSCHRLLQPSELSCGWGDPRGVKRLIINWCQRFGLFPIQGGLSLFCATKSAVDYAREVLEFDVLNIASATTKGFVCLSECSLSSAT